MKIPIVPGHEFAGEVVAVGADVGRWRAGDRVVGLYAATCGTCSQCVGGDERRCRNLAEAFGLTHDGGYAEFVLAHERALEEGASGGVGSAAIQTAKLLGATTWAVTSGEQKASQLMPLERAADAHRLLEARSATGRVVLVP